MNRPVSIYSHPTRNTIQHLAKNTEYNLQAGNTRAAMNATLPIAVGKRKILEIKIKQPDGR